MMRATTVTLTDEQFDQVTMLAKRLGISRSEVLRRIVDHVVIPEHEGRPFNWEAVFAAPAARKRRRKLTRAI